MTDLSTSYLGLTLPHPVVPSAARPLSRDVDAVLRLEDGGAAAVVLHSLFEEQVVEEEAAIDHYLERGTESCAESLGWFPKRGEYAHRPEEYLELVRRAKERLSVPAVGSLNGVTAGGWTEYAARIEEAGADVVNLCSVILEEGPEKLGEIRDGLGRLARGARVRVPRPGPREHEPGLLPRARRLRTGELREAPAHPLKHR